MERRVWQGPVCPPTPVAAPPADNWQIYEGVRFGFLLVRNFSGPRFTITGLRVVAQTLPVPYLGEHGLSLPSRRV
jgi:hypothetical protein